VGGKTPQNSRTHHLGGSVDEMKTACFKGKRMSWKETKRALEVPEGVEREVILEAEEMDGRTTL
jgi:hypothetical protein